MILSHKPPAYGSKDRFLASQELEIRLLAVQNRLCLLQTPDAEAFIKLPMCHPVLLVEQAQPSR
jgi:hypothetical protein